MNSFMEIAKLRAARLLWAKLMSHSSRRTTLAVAAHALPDFGLVARRAGRLQQRGRAPVIEAMAATQGEHAVAAHQFARRSAGAADRFLRPHRAQHADRVATGSGRHAHRRSVGRLVLCRAPHRTISRARRGRISRKSKSSAACRRRSRPAFRSCASRKPPPGRRRASMPGSSRSSASTNTSPTDEAPIDVLKVDNAAVRAIADSTSSSG